MSHDKAVVIGAGLGGLAAAALLARDGWNVTVLEKNDGPGGRARTWSESGFLYDMGPSWYLMPSAFERYFALFGKKPADYFDLVRLDPSYRVFYEPGDFVDVAADPAGNSAAFDRLEPDGAAKTRRFMERAAEQYDLAVRHFLYRDYDGLSSFLRRDIIKYGPRLGFIRNVHDLVKSEIRAERLQQILEYTMVFIGGSPRKTPAFYALMSYIDQGLGVWYPMGGINRLVGALHELGQSLGVRYEFSRPARKIDVEGGRVRAVSVDGGSFDADVVIANADYHHVETQLLDGGLRTYSDRYWRRRVLSPSAFILYCGLNERLEGLRHHNLYFASDWDRHFATVFGRKSWPDDFSYYVSCPSQTDPAVAPPGKENLFFLVPVAPGLDDTDDVREAFAGKVLDQFEGLIGRPVRKSFEVRRIFSQRDFTDDYNTYLGTAFGLSHTLFQTAAFRPQSRSRRVPNLYFCGQYTHPGVGMPMIMIAAELTAARIARERS